MSSTATASSSSRSPSPAGKITGVTPVIDTAYNRALRPDQLVCRAAARQPDPASPKRQYQRGIRRDLHEPGLRRVPAGRPRQARDPMTALPTAAVHETTEEPLPVPMTAGTKSCEASIGSWARSCPSRSASAGHGDRGLRRYRRCARLDRADAVFSTWKPNSPMSLLRRGVCPRRGTFGASRGARAVRLARRRSTGWFDPWKMPGGLDPTGLVKGWAAEQALGELPSAGVRGGDGERRRRPRHLRGARAGPAWRIGVRHPFAAGARLRRRLAGSPGDLGCYERGAHVIDPRSRGPRARLCLRDRRRPAAVARRRPRHGPARRRGGGPGRSRPSTATRAMSSRTRVGGR